ncbi:MAG: glycosyltransferase [Eubacterium sp.]|nr:glycosyltransferase [Eubacterium sp.]
MNIVFVVTKIGRGGAQRVSVALAGYLIERGHNVSILYYDEEGTYPLKEGIQTYRLPYSKNVVLKHIKRIFSFIKYNRKNKTDLVIALFRGYDYTYIYKKLFGTKLILSQRNDPKAEYDNDFLARLGANVFFNNADKVVFQTEEEKDYFGEKIKQKGYVVGNPVSEGLPEPYEGERRKDIVNFCRLVPQKNLKLLIDAFKEVCKVRDDYRLTIFGNGYQRDELAEYITDNDLGGKAVILPFSADIHNLVKDAAMFVSSSDYEGISNSMLEAMALGLPCICTDCPAGGTREVIKDGVNGLLVPVGDKEALTSAILRVINEPELGKRLGKAAAMVRTDLSADKICSEWERVICD